MADEERDPYLLDRHHLLKNAIIQTGPDKVARWYVPRDDFEAMVKERDELRKALALVNVGVRIRDPRVRIDVGKVLDSVGQTAEQAHATGSVILSAQERKR